MSKIKISQELMMAAAAHAAERGMSLEEYVQEFVEKMQQQQKKNKYKDEGPKYEGPWGKDLGLK